MLKKKLYIVGGLSSGLVYEDSVEANKLAEAHGLTINRLPLSTTATLKEGRHIKIDRQGNFKIKSLKKYMFSEEWTSLNVQVDLHMGFIRVPLSLSNFKNVSSDLELTIKTFLENVENNRCPWLNNAGLVEEITTFLKIRGLV